MKRIALRLTDRVAPSLGLAGTLFAAGSRRGVQAIEPSATDVGQAFYPDALYILVSLASDEEDPADASLPSVPTVRAWRIVDGETFEVELLVEAGV